MVLEKEEKSDAGFAKIKPAAVNLTAISPVAPTNNSPERTKRPVVLWLGLGALLAAAVAVVFLLPRWITPPVAQTQRVAPALGAAPVTSGQPLPSSAAKANTPWERAQQSRLRKETQDLLAQMLEAQDILVDNGVNAWAEDEYARAMKIAKAGDIVYNAGDFSQARIEYAQALVIFTQLLDQVDEIFEATIEKGHQALVDGDSATAKQAFDLALAMDALDRLAISGRGRADKLDAVLALIDQGDRQIDDGQFEDAKEHYRQALELDGESALAAQKIQHADEKIRDREFNRSMSSGFNALQAGRFRQARNAFAQAQKLKPNSVEARSALAQTDHKVVAIRINSLLAEGANFESDERWHDALAKYQAALKLDAVSADAQAGRERSSLRAKIDDRLRQILATPKRLYDPDVHAETVSFHRKIRLVSQPEPKLAAQISALAIMLEKAVTPVSIRLQSDNLTNVTMYKMGELGFFTTKDLTVRPGRYVALGYRDGYLDARVEFDVEPDQPMQTVTIQTTTKITTRLNN